MRLRPRVRLRDVLGAHGLGVDRNEGVGASERQDLGAEVLEHRAQHVARHARVLVQCHAHSRKGAHAEEVGVARDIGLQRRGIDRRQGRRRQRLGHGHLRIEDGLLVRLVDLAVGTVELDAVAVEGDVAAGDDDARGAVQRAVVGQRGRGQGADKNRLVPGVADRLDAGRGDARAAGAQVVADDDARAGGGDAAQEGLRVGVADRIRQIGDEAAHAAGAEAGVMGVGEVVEFCAHREWEKRAKRMNLAPAAPGPRGFL